MAAFRIVASLDCWFLRHQDQWQEAYLRPIFSLDLSPDLWGNEMGVEAGDRFVSRGVQYRPGRWS